MSPICSNRHHLAIALIVGLGLAAFAGAAQAQSVSVDLGDGETLPGRVVQIVLLVTLLSLAPGIAIMVTCFPFIVTVLSLLRQGIGLQQSPPNMLIVSLALFLTFFVMEPVFQAAWDDAISPMMNGTLSTDEAIVRGIVPFRGFMESRVRDDVLVTLADAAPGRSADLVPGEPPPLTLLIPAFMLTEIERAFEIGFIIFLPFLVIDLVVASILMSMGMMMVPPVVVSLPLKLAFFVVADGWSLLAAALIRGYAT